MKNDLGRYLTCLFVLACIRISACNGIGIGDVMPLYHLTKQTDTKIIPMNATNNSATTLANYNSIAYGNGTYVIVGSKGSIIVSDGTNWNNISTNISENLNGVIFDYVSFAFYAVGDAGTVMSSSDGVNWIIFNPLTPRLNLHSITVGDGNILITADSGTIFELNPSQNNLVKPYTNKVLADAGENMLSSAYGNGMFIVGGDQGSILYNSLSTWSSPTWNRANKFAGIAMNGFTFATDLGVFLAAGSAGNILSSSNGITWSQPFRATTSNLNAIATNVGSGVITTVGGSSGYGVVIFSDSLSDWVSSPIQFTVQLNDVKCFNQNCYSVGDNGTIVSNTNSLGWSIVSGGITGVKEPLQTKFKGTSKAVPPSLMTSKCTVNMQLNLTDGSAVYVYFNGAEQPQCENNASCTINSSTSFNYNWQTQLNPSKNLVLEIDDRKYDITAYCNN